MVLVWQTYTSDLNRAYPLYALGISQTNEVTSTIDAVNLLPSNIVGQLIRTRSACGVSGLIARRLSLWTSEGANFLLDYPVPFNEDLAQDLTADTRIQAWEFIGERIRYGRLRRLLDNV